MKFMMLMIPAVLPGWQTTAPDFKPERKKYGSDGTVQRRMGKAFEIESLNGLHPLPKGARVSSAKAALRDRRTVHRSKEVLGVTGWWSAVQGRSGGMGAALPANEATPLRSGKSSGRRFREIESVRRNTSAWFFAAAARMR